MPPHNKQNLAAKAHALGGWLMLPLCLFCTAGAFLAADSHALGEELILAALALWSGCEFSRFMRRRKNK